MSPKKAGTDGMKQTKLDFSSGKRTASIAGLGKTKVGPTTPVAPAALAATSSPATPAGIAPNPTISVESPTAARVTRAKAARQAKVEDAVKDVKEGWEEEDKDEIEPAEDFTGSDSDTESLSSVTTFETVGTIEERVAPAPASPVAGRTTRSSVQNQMQTLNISKASVDSLVPAERTVKEEEVDEIESANDFDMEMGMDVFKPSNASEAELARRVEANDNIAKEKEGTLPELRVKAVKWRKYHDMLKKKYGDLPTIHGENENKIHQILRYFDNIYEYGPCIGVTRRQRWDRAQALGLNPPKEISDILNTMEGRTKDEYVHSVFYGQV